MRPGILGTFYNVKCDAHVTCIADIVGEIFRSLLTGEKGELLRLWLDIPSCVAASSLECRGKLAVLSVPSSLVPLAVQPRTIPSSITKHAFPTKRLPLNTQLAVVPTLFSFSP